MNLYFLAAGLIYSAFIFNYLIPVFILFLLLGNLAVFVLISLKEKETETIKTSIPQFILFGLAILLVILGIY